MANVESTARDCVAACAVALAATDSDGATGGGETTPAGVPELSAVPVLDGAPASPAP